MDLNVAKVINGRIKPPEKRPLDLKWVYAYKFDSGGYLEKSKARICVRGDQQPESLLSTAAITLASKTFRLMMALMAYFNLESMQYDFVNAFLNAEIDEEVYTKMPPGFVKEDCYWRLNKALYGLRRSPLLWHRELSEFLQSIGFQAVPEDPCVMTNNGIIIFFYVDDLVGLYHPSKKEEYRAIHQSIQGQYNVKVLGDLHWFLGIEVLRNRERRKVWLSQRSYIQKIAHKFNCIDVNNVTTPLSTEPLVTFDGTASEAEIKRYQAIIGSINYPAVITRPDVALAASKLAQFLTNPSPQHMAAGLNCIRYLYQFKDLCVVFDGSIEVLEMMSDAAFGDNLDDRKSTQGYALKLFGGVVFYRSGKQNTVTTSSTEAELLALSQAAKELMAFKRLRSD
ncbi:hypothetical protein PWT90_11245 [Aphanocladium album]|nr:hypothetical protein PWT90_11245 [Aphanocladium album]